MPKCLYITMFLITDTLSLNGVNNWLWLSCLTFCYLSFRLVLALLMAVVLDLVLAPVTSFLFLTYIPHCLSTARVALFSHQFYRGLLIQKLSHIRGYGQLSPHIVPRTSTRPPGTLRYDPQKCVSPVRQSFHPPWIRASRFMIRASVRNVPRGLRTIQYQAHSIVVQDRIWRELWEYPGALESAFGAES